MAKLPEENLIKVHDAISTGGDERREMMTAWSKFLMG
jgi:hypothetical protein